MLFEQCPCSGNTLGKLLHPAILSVLTGGPLHGYRLMERLAPLNIFRGERPDRAGVYRVLRSLEESGFVSGEWDLWGSGPARRIYHLTPNGRLCLETWLQTLSAYRDAIDELIVRGRAALTAPAAGDALGAGTEDERAN